MVFGIVSLSTGWIPIVCFVSVFFGAAAVVVGVRRRRVESARSAATVGIVTGTFGLALSLVGIWLSVLIVQSVANFEDPGPYRAELTECAEVDGATRATGEITNLDDRERTYTVRITFDDDSTVESIVSDVAPGERRVFEVDEDLRFPELSCSIVEVKGPRPFGLATQ